MNDKEAPNNIAKIRNELGITQDKVAKELGCNVTYISYLENGNIKTGQVDRVMKIAKMFDVTVEELFKK